MSSTEHGSEECQLKGGHLPAVKAGGMRIVQSKTKDETKSSNHLEENKVSNSPPKNMLISGALARGHADFPPEAVQHFHEKPIPTHDNRPMNYRPQQIQQPRKQ